MEGWLKASWDGEKGIDKEIMRNEPATLAFFILRLISFLNVYVTSYFCHSCFTHVKTEAQTEWLGSSSMPGLDKGTTRPSLKVLEPSRIGTEWRLKGSVLLGHLGGCFCRAACLLPRAPRKLLSMPGGRDVTQEGEVGVMGFMNFDCMMVWAGSGLSVSWVPAWALRALQPQQRSWCGWSVHPACWEFLASLLSLVELQHRCSTQCRFVTPMLFQPWLHHGVCPSWLWCGCVARLMLPVSLQCF